MTDNSQKLLGSLAASCQAARFKPLQSNLRTLRRAPDEGMGGATAARSAGDAIFRVVWARATKRFPSVASGWFLKKAQSRLTVGEAHFCR